MKSKINANRALMAEKAKLTKLFTLLTILLFGVGQMWAVDYNLINDNDNASTATLNTDDFWTAQSLQAKSNGGDLKKCIIFGGNISAGITNVSYPSRYISYGVKTTSVTITIKAYQSNNSAKKINIYEVNEAANGALTITNTKEESVSKGLQTITFTASPAAGTRSTIYITSQAASNFEFYQVTASETGTALTNLIGGRVGYAIDYSKKSRLATKSGEDAMLDGILYYHLSSDYKPNNGTSVQLKTGNYIKFNTIEPVLLTVETGSAYKFYVAKTADGTTNEKAATATHKIKLNDASDWYIVGGASSATQIKSIAFDALYQVVYAPGTGASGSMETMYGYEGEEITLPACTFTAPTGSEFDGWIVTKTASGDAVTVTDSKFTMPAEAITVTATWKTETTKYDITYNKGTYGTGEIASGKKSEGEAYTLSSERFTRAGYVQVGWATTDGGAKAYDLGGSYTTDAEQEFFPVWAETSTYVASFACGATAPSDWTFSNAGFDADNKATVDYVCTFTANNLTAPSTNGMSADAVAFAKNVSAIATFDLGAATTVTALNVTLYGGSSSAFNETIEYLGADGSTVKKEYVNSLGAGNWAANNISKTEIVDGVRYIRIHGAGKWVVMSAFSVTYVDLVPKYDLAFAKNGGSGDMATLKYAENAEVTLPSCSFTPPDDHVFDGWVVTKTASSDPITVTDGKFTMPAEAVTATAQWATISDFDVKFFQGYGDPNAQIGETQSISTGGHAVAPADPTRTGFAFLGWSYDATEAHIVDVATYSITAATNFTAMWKAVWTVTFDGAGNVEVQDGETVASPDSPTQAGKIFQGWYNGENKYDFSAAVTGNLALTAKWATADLNHFYYTYNDDFHFDGVVYKTPEGKTTDPEAAEATLNLTTPYAVYSGAEGITSIIATNGIYDYKKGADTKHVTAYLKLKKNDATSNLAFTIKSGYTAVLKIKMGGYSNNPVVTLKKGDDAVPATSGTIGGTATGKNYNEITYDLTAGTYVMTSADQTLYISHIDLEATALPTHSVTYKPGDGEGAWVVDADATEVADCPGTFTAPTGKVFNGWKNESDDSDVEVGAAVATDMNLIAQWINHYAVTFNMNGHGDAIDPQDVKEGAKAAKPDDPSESGYDFGGWFTDNGTFEAPFDFNTPITAATPLYAKWTADPCPDSEKKSIVKAVMTSTSTATVTGYNDNEYAGGYIINNLADGDNAFAYDFGEGSVTGYKLKGSGSAIFATLAKGGFEAGDKVIFAVTKKAGDNKLAVYAAKDKDNVLKLAEIDVADAGIYEYKLKAADIAAIEAAGADYKSIGSYRGDYNPYIYSVELKGCRSWAVMHTLTFKNFDGTATIAAEPLEEGAYASTVAPAAPKITLKRFLGWAEAVDGTPVDLTTYTITEDKTLYAVYEDIVCPTTGTVYKFEIKDELPSENLPTSTDKDMSSYITATGDGYLTYTATANNKATINSDGTIQMKDASAAYLKVELECALAAGDQIRAHVTNNPMRVQVGTTYDSNKDLILAKNAYEFVAITSAMEGKQVLYITRSSNGNANLADFEIYRPAKYDVSFNMMGHGSAIADIEDVIEGSKITAPSPAPTDVDYSFAGWYKENTLENEWDFDVDVVDDNITLYAKWLDKSDATLKWLKYDETEITLEVGVYTYNVSLPAFTSAVPALTAETSNPNATKVIANATAFDSEGNATSTVTVTPEVGADRVYTVNFAKGVEILLQDVTKSTTWNFANAVTGTVNITGTPQVLANYGGVTNDNTFESDKLEASGEKFTAGSKPNLRANYIHLHTTVPGMLTISYSNTGGNPARYIYVNGAKYDEDGSANTTPKGADRKVFVPAGDVELVMKDGEDASKNVQIYQIIFKAPDYTRSVSNNIGTLCVDHNVPEGGALGATFYQLVGKEPTYGKLVFDEVTELEAGKPYIFQSTTGGITLFYGETTAPAPEEVNGMVGSFSDKHVEINESNKTNIMYIAGNKLWDCSDLTPDPGYLDVVANRAYIFNYSGIGAASPNPAPGRRRITVGKDQATGFDQLDASETPMKLIIDGQLFILRGEKMYNANGQLVK